MHVMHLTTKTHFTPFDSDSDSDTAADLLPRNKEEGATNYL
jgi:hypothetical protein